MILNWSKIRVFVKPGDTDMRKQINGLLIIVSEELRQDPFEGNLFLFCKKPRRLLKNIYINTAGFTAAVVATNSFTAAGSFTPSATRATSNKQTLVGFVIQGY